MKERSHNEERDERREKKRKREDKKEGKGRQNAMNVKKDEFKKRRLTMEERGQFNI